MLLLVVFIRSGKFFGVRFVCVCVCGGGGGGGCYITLPDLDNHVILFLCQLYQDVYCFDGTCTLHVEYIYMFILERLFSFCITPFITLFPRSQLYDARGFNCVTH